MVNLRQDNRGNYYARKRIPDKLREEYGKQYGKRLEEKFSAPASVGRLEAERRFNEWKAEITRRFENAHRTLRGEGIDLGYKQATALAGQWYTWFVAQHENEPGEPGGYWDAALDDLISDMRWHYAVHVDPDDPWKDEYGNTGKEIMRDPEVRKKMRPIIADLGHTAQFLASPGIPPLNNEARDLFLDCVLINSIPALLRLEQNAEGNYQPDELLKTFPPFEPHKTTGPTGPTPTELFEQWVTYTKPKHSTVTGWGLVFKTLTRDFQGRSASSITPAEAQAWLDRQITKERSASTVRNNWLTAAKTVYVWARRRGKVPSNPFADVVVEKHRRPEHRKHLFDHEIATILRAASAITDTRNPNMAVRRWVPWILAYTGARPGEITQLRGQDVKQIDGTWCVDLTPDAGTIKNDKARQVPLHGHLVEQGFLDFAKGRSGPLFYRPRSKQQQDASDLSNQKKSAAATARSLLSEWVREIGINDPHLIRPLHAWRHTFKLKGDSAGLPEKALDYICGHAPVNVGRRYGKPELKDLARVIEKFPRYPVGGD